MKRFRFLLLFTAMASLASATLAANIPVVLPTVANANFETDAGLFNTFPGYTSGGGTNPAEITSWPGGPGAGGRGINPGVGAGTPFRDNGNNLTNVAFLQGNGRTISQSISGWEVGENYRIAFDYNARSASGGNTSPFTGITAAIGGSTFIDSAVPPVGGSNSYYAGNILFTPTMDTNTLSFTANVTSGDRTALVDNVRVFRNGPAIADNGFENPNQGANTWKQANGVGGGTLVGSAWNITGSAGITQNISAFQNGGIPAPEGIQHGLIQGNGEFTQTISGFEAGSDYTLSLLTMARQSGAGGNDLEVLLDAGLVSEISLLDIPEITFSSFTELTSPSFLAEKDSYALTIRGTLDGGNLSGDRTTFFDNVFFNQQSSVVPEPATVSIWLALGMMATGGMWWRRRRAA